jgi:hypothetical protein
MPACMRGLFCACTHECWYFSVSLYTHVRQTLTWVQVQYIHQQVAVAATQVNNLAVATEVLQDTACQSSQHTCVHNALSVPVLLTGGDSSLADAPELDCDGDALNATACSSAGAASS